MTHLHNRGVSVNGLGPSEIIDAFHTRRTIETRTLIESHVDHPAARRMQKAAGDELQALKIPDWQAVEAADVEFHGAVTAPADGCDSRQPLRRALLSSCLCPTSWETPNTCT